MFGLWGIRIKEARINEVWLYTDNIVDSSKKSQEHEQDMSNMLTHEEYRTQRSI